MGKVSQHFMEEIVRDYEIADMRRALGCSPEEFKTKEKKDGTK